MEQSSTHSSKNKFKGIFRFFTCCKSEKNKEKVVKPRLRIYSRVSKGHIKYV